MAIDNFVTEYKFDQLRAMNGDVFNNVAISGNMVFSLQHDLRTKPNDIVIENKAEVKTRGLSFTCVATTHLVCITCLNRTHSRGYRGFATEMC